MSHSDPSAIPPRSAAGKAAWRRAQIALPLREKVRILLDLQKQDLPLISRRRPLRSWEQPWSVEP